VGPRCSHLRDDARIPAVLRQLSDPDLRENRAGADIIPGMVTAGYEGHCAAVVHERLIFKVGEYETWWV